MGKGKGYLAFILIGACVVTVLISYYLQDQLTLSQAGQGGVSPIKSFLPFKVLEFMAITGIGWCLQSFYAKYQQRENLKIIARSAYRRISDTLKTLSILQNDFVEKQKNDSYKDIRPLLNSFQNLSDAIELNMRSAAVDWIDGIDEDLKKIKDLEELNNKIQSREASITDTNDYDDLENLKHKRSKLDNEIPAILRDEGLMRPTSSYKNSSKMVLQALNQKLRNGQPLDFAVSIIEDISLETIQEENTNLFLVINSDSPKYGNVSLVLDDNIVGKIENKYREFGWNDEDFASGLSEFLKSNNLNIENNTYFHGQTPVEFLDRLEDDGKLRIRVKIVIS